MMEKEAEISVNVWQDIPPIKPAFFYVQLGHLHKWLVINITVSQTDVVPARLLVHFGNFLSCWFALRLLEFGQEHNY